MSKQERIQRQKGAAPQAEDQAAASHDTTSTDDLLDEIDGVLEQNAEDFVRDFVQKSGE